MKNLFRIFNIIFGCIIVAFAYDVFIIPNSFISFGIDGVGSLMYLMNNLNPSIVIIVINLLILLMCSFFFDKNKIYLYLLSAVMIPIFIYLIGLLNISIELPETILNVLCGGVLTGFGYSIIYKQGGNGGTIFLIEELISKLTRYYSRYYSAILDVIILLIGLLYTSYSNIIYSAILIIISRMMVTKARFSLKNSKMFYVITKKEKEVKNFLLHDMKYQITVLDVKGGFTKKENQIILTVIPSNDYYKIKEGIKVIDEDAFIAITDTYDVINRKDIEL